MANRFIELRLFRLHPGNRDQFAARFAGQLLPLHRRHGIKVVAWGPSLHDQDSFYVVRAHPSVEARQEAMDAMLGSDEWLMNQEETVLEMIESYNTCVIEASDSLIDALRIGLVGISEKDTPPPSWR